MSNIRQLFTAQTADGASAAVGWNGGPGQVEVDGTFGSGTVTLQASPDNGTTWLALNPTVAFTAASIQSFNLNAGFLVRVSLAGSTNPSLNARLFGL